MGSVVLDAVNSFFHSSPHPQHQHVFRESTPRSQRRSSTPPPPQAKRSRSPLRAEASHMSDSAQRAHSSSAASQNPPTAELQQHAAAHNAARAPSRASQQRPAPPPASPPLAGRLAPPPSDGSQPPLVSTGDNPNASLRSRPRKIKVRDLEHIQSFASEDMGSFSEIRSRSRSRSRGAEDDRPQYEISEMKVEHIIEMVAGLLTKITTTNDRQHEHLHRQPLAIDAASHVNPQTNSVLAFHGKNVPSITILSYLSRINKYCPTSYEVFLSLLVYFDRMTERVNAGPMQSLREASQAVDGRTARSFTEPLGSDGAMEGVTATTPLGTQQATPPHSGGMEKSSQRGAPGTPHSRPTHPESPSMLAEPAMIDPYNLSHFFVVDSFNIHRLVIAGVTCASKFFSDIFYTNSRYAKVGGLPLPELNHLELQFLLLNDFRLSVPVEEIEAYGTMLVEFYAREVVAQQKAAEAMQMRSLSESSNDSTSTIRAAN
ncbi:PHO85 cyclin-7 [Lecanosticta acicola]|uniref:PHO85 cyclin-7 n=1 Tax=Lecanosticta acicola TaxID=111012 RepID=A0AAI9E849_9PEZI|nr:PHO85 cyclin-7 [Lecanosticta acicola]